MVASELSFLVWDLLGLQRCVLVAHCNHDMWSFVLCLSNWLLLVSFFSFFVFPGRICCWRWVGGVGMWACLPCNMHPPVAWVKELVSHLQSICVSNLLTPFLVVSPQESAFELSIIHWKFSSHFVNNNFFSLSLFQLWMEHDKVSGCIWPFPNNWEGQPHYGPMTLKRLLGWEF